MTITPGIALVGRIVLVALVLFVTEPVPADIMTLRVMVTLMLVEPLTAAMADAGLIASQMTIIWPEQGLSGFASPASTTVLAMFILREGLRRTGIAQTLGSVISGFINNTAAVAILLPMVIDVADRRNTFLSKLLLPLSYASMFGRTLTLIGTSTNVLARDVAARLAVQYPTTDLHAMSMFELTP